MNKLPHEACNRAIAELRVSLAAAEAKLADERRRNDEWAAYVGKHPDCYCHGCTMVLANAARRGPQRSEDRSVTDADREAAVVLLEKNASRLRFGLASIAELSVDVAQAIARARADADEAGYSRGLREGAASERGACAEYADNYALFGRNGVRIAKAIRARGEGGKA